MAMLNNQHNLSSVNAHADKNTDYLQVRLPLELLRFSTSQPNHTGPDYSIVGGGSVRGRGVVDGDASIEVLTTEWQST